MWNHQKHCRYDNWEEHDNNTKKQRGLRRGGLSNGCGAKKQGAEWGGGGKEGCKQVNGRGGRRRGTGWRPGARSKRRYSLQFPPRISY